MFVDPIEAVIISPPAGWALVPTGSLSLIHLEFADWAAPTRELAVSLARSSPLIPADAPDSEWERVVQEQLAPDDAEIESRGPVVLARSMAAGRGARFAWVRGPRVFAIVELRGSAPDGPLEPPELAQALRTLKVPVNHRLATYRSQDEWIAEMDAAREDRGAGRHEAAARHLGAARDIAKGTWLLGLVEGQVDVCAAARHAEATLALAKLWESTPFRAVPLLYEATNILDRCRGSLPASPWPMDSPEGRALKADVSRLWAATMRLHAEWGSTPAPGDSLRAAHFRSALFQRALECEQERAEQRTDGADWVTQSTLATMAFEDAMSAVAGNGKATEARPAYADLPPERRAQLAAYGVRDEASLKACIDQDEIDLLDNLVAAGEAISSVTLAAVSESACSMRANALLAARRLVGLASTAERCEALVKIMNGYSSALGELGDAESLEAAWRILGEAQGVLDELAVDGTLRAMTCANQAWVCLGMGRPETGLPLAERAVAIARASGIRSTLAKARCCYSRLLGLSGRCEEALAEAGRALAVDDPASASTVHETLGRAHHRLGDNAAALREIGAGLRCAQARNPPLGGDVQHLLAAAALVWEGHDLRACRLARQAIDLVEEARRVDIGGTMERIAYDDSRERREEVERLVQAELDAGDPFGAVAAADRHRGRLLVEGDMQHAPETGFEPVPHIAGNASVEEQVAFAAAQARAFLRRWGIPPLLTGADVSSLVEAHGRTVVVLQPNGSELRSFILKPGTPASVVPIVAAVSLDTLHRSTNALRREMALNVSARAARGELPQQSTDEEENSSPDVSEGASARLSLLRSEVYVALLSRIVPLLHDREPFVLVPYRELSLLPLAVLTGEDGRVLIEQHPVSVLPSLASLATMRRPSSAPPRAVVVGDPLLAPHLDMKQLPGAAAEASEIDKLLREAGVVTTLLPGEKATEEAFRTSVKGARVVHMACHGRCYEPASASRLFLSRSAHNDGLLQPAEIAGLRLDGALVVLSACESGLGRTSAEGVLGLGHAFLRAGARALVLSLWRVNDAETAFLMRELYGGLLGAADHSGRRLDVAAALARAQMLARGAKGGHLSDWGAWLLVGDGSWKLG